MSGILYGAAAGAPAGAGGAVAGAGGAAGAGAGARPIVHGSLMVGRDSRPLHTPGQLSDASVIPLNWIEIDAGILRAPTTTDDFVIPPSSEMEAES